MDKNELLKKRRLEFDKFHKERLPVLVEFAEDLGYSSPHLIVKEPIAFLSSLSDYLKEQEIDNETRNWLVTRVGYFLGECLIQEFQGVWYLDDNPDSLNFTNYVVGNFELPVKKQSIDTFKYAIEYVNESLGRDLNGTYYKIRSHIN